MVVYDFNEQFQYYRNIRTILSIGSRTGQCFFSMFIYDFVALEKLYPIIWKLVFPVIGLVKKRSWLRSTVGFFVCESHWLFQAAYAQLNKCNRTNSTRDHFWTPFVIVCDTRNGISQIGRFHQLTSPLLCYELKRWFTLRTGSLYLDQLFDDNES